ncbi:LacI family DNA-binding transcriptional regulator [Ramlibacter sp. WS9]|uniref:LacI family DNA-binding transcriptional regulator n=1 Tax=Ramlibacter sp. WS9 TaxID=1882741 RepID=UPI0011415201|nr:LacI family DNA-binding transcriptional regulator [Ramlibacter sp. WS9]ROZ76715.1 LacI family DNA-binding transcriptional regulator [Ramlibacter sp. WS9]
MSVDSRPTLEDVARLAGVSLGSASRALSIPDQVKPVTLEKVQRAVEQLGYVRNGAAQALASRRTRTVAAVYPTLDNPIFAVSIQSLQRTLWTLGYQLLVASHEYKPEREAEVLRAILERGVDGIVLVGTDHADAVFDLARQYRLPYVMTWSTDERGTRDCIGFSYYDAAYEMASLVAQYGHSRIALCSGVAQGNERVRARIAATRAALKAAGLELRPEWMEEQPFTFDGGRQAVRNLMTFKTPPTALICGNDIQAVGAMGECRDRGLRVPDDLSVTGSDDVELANLVEPRLTTVHVPTVEIGVRAARRIVELIEDVESPAESDLVTRLVVRESLRRLSPG